MPTLSDLAKTQQTTQVGSAQSGGVGSAGGTNIQATKIIDRSEGLIKDIGKMLGTTVTAVADASEYAGKRVGIDNLSEYKKSMDIIDATYKGKANLTSADMVEKSRLEQGAYELHMQKGSFGDNSLANQAFKDTYAVPATNNLFKNKAANEAKRSALFGIEEDRAVQDEIEAIGKDFDTATHYDAFRTRMSNANNNPDKVDNYVAKAFNADVNKLHDINRELLIYNADGTVNNQLQMEVFNNLNGKVVEIDENGTVTMTKLNDAGTMAIVKNWKQLVSAKKSTSGKIDLKFNSVTGNVGEGVNVIGAKLQGVNEQMGRLVDSQTNGLGKVSPSTWNTAFKKRAELTSMGQQAQSLNGAITNIFKGDVGSFILFDKDTIVEYEHQNVTTGGLDKSTYTMSKDQKNKRLNDAIRNRENNLDNPTIPINDKIANVTELINAENITGVKSDVLTRKVTNLTDGLIQGKSVNDKYSNFAVAQTKISNRSVPYVGWANKKTLDAIGVEYLEAVNELSNENLSSSEKTKLENDWMVRLDSIMQVHKNNYETNKFTSGESKIVHNAFVDAQEAKLFEWSWGDGKMSTATMKAVTDGAIYTAAGSITNDNVGDVVSKYQSNNMIKLSNEWFGKDGQVIVKPQGYTNQSTGAMLDRIEKDISDGLKGTEYADINLEDGTQAQLNSNINSEGVISTVVILRHNVTGEILYTREYHGGELVKGLTVEEKKQ